MPQITISPSTYKRLLLQSTSFHDTPDAVIGRLLDGAEQPAARKPRDAGPTRAPAAPGSILPVGQYWRPILSALDEAGGSGHASDVIDALEERMSDALKDQDREILSNGEVRWRNRARFARLRMKERGLLSGASPRGIWEITAAGREYLNA